MKWYYNMKISAKLIIGFVLVALIAAIVGVVAIVNIQQMNELNSDMYERHTSTMDDVAIILADYQQERAIIRDMLILEDEELRQTKMESLTELDQQTDESMALFEAGIQSEEMRGYFESLEQAIVDFRTYRDNIIEMSENGQVEEATESLYSDGVAINEAMTTSGTNILNLKVQRSKESSDTITQLSQTATITMIVVIAVGVLISLALGIFISRIISRPINAMVIAANRLSEGDVAVNVTADTKDEVGMLAESFGRMIENIRAQVTVVERIAAGDLSIEVNVRSQVDLLNKKLAEMVTNNNEVLSNIKAASDQVAAGSRQVSDSSIALSQGATEQASSIEQLTASLEEISSQTKLNAQNANQANELAEVAKTNALKGNSQMKEMQKAMEEINESSTNISKIIKVIDEIAFQTNILALNAAVEAARAGQHGKGFAVVAEEVRNLAARSANAAKETTDMISGSISKVAAGTKIADETAEALNKIVEDVAKAANLVGDIAIASNEQATGI
ncbi:MAG: HAMP domain-containing protein, partial [Clostridiales bacterium]|nr:HAMP domain-containing protein [Clostridiales bacterium]